VEAEQKAVVVGSIGAVDMGTAVEAAVAVDSVQLCSLQVDIEVVAHWHTGTNAEGWDLCMDTSAYISRDSHELQSFTHFLITGEDDEYS